MTMKSLGLTLILTFIYTGLFSQKANSLNGRVTDKETGMALPGATVLIKGTRNSAVTNNDGIYRIQNAGEGQAILLVSFVGYETLERPVSITENPITVDITLTPVFKTGDDIVVSPSKRPEKIVNAPASIQVIGKKELEQFTGSNTLELLSKVQGVETVRIGVDGVNLNARGFNNNFNNKVFLMIDGRNSMSAISTSVLLGNNSSMNKDDIDKMEILLGPQTALYGPNVHNMLINVITKDPRKYQGTTVSLSAGNQKQFSGRFRHAEKIDKNWAYKLTGEYAAGTNFDFYDSVKVGGGPGGVFGPRTTIPEKIDPDFRRYRGEAHVYYSIKSNTEIIITTGGSKYDFSMIGRNQIKGMENIFLQGRYVSPHLYANIYNAWANSGFALGVGPYTRDLWNRTRSISTDPKDPNHRLTLDSAEIFATRRSNRLIENNQRLNAELQYNYNFEKQKLFLVTGLSYQIDRPRAYGNTLVDSFERIKVKQYGVVLQLEKSFPWQIRFIVAARLDRHSGYGNYFSPKLGLVKSMAGGSFRFTWGQAYSMPSISWQYASNGGSFFGNREGITYIPNGTKVNDAVTRVTTPLKPERASTWEFGYKGNLIKKLYVDISYYNGLSRNFFTPTISVGGRATHVGGRRVTHDPESAGAVDSTTGILSNARFSTIFNFGDVKVYGFDAGLTYTFNKFVNVSIKYSWIGSDITKGNVANDANRDTIIGPDEKSLNSPTNRVIVVLDFQNLCRQRMFVNLSVRYISQYDFYSGTYISTKAGKGKIDTIKVISPAGIERTYPKNFNWGPLGGFTTIDLAAVYKFNPMLSLGMNITNLFNTDQREYAGSPLIKRLIMFELKMQIPNLNNKQQLKKH
jgi:iron complex outermembrane receptor protein